ncbi:MAG: hypothetical protein Q3959_02675 [Limosilactobacillus sp.]|uniref:hypothetical protein n=1 Tax=Limosilactobacillus sp. TaxID=2773925 RepID=UPI0027092A40|nr:hypothetical protein [Limosilactobacillus sp.]
MKKQHSLSLGAFFKELKALVKPGYLAAMWPAGGMTLIYMALACVISLFISNILQAMMMSVMLMMYGMASPVTLLFGLLEMIVGLVVLAGVGFYYSFYTTATQFAYLDKIEHPDHVVSAGSIWMYFKHLRKNQLWRIILYVGLFAFLWSLPLTIIGDLVAAYTKNAIAVNAIKILNVIVVAWKSIEYSQANFLYREKQPQFLGQSMRRALTASRRFMGGRKMNYLLVTILFVLLPIVVWIAIFGGLAFYGAYTAAYALTYIGLALVVLGFACYSPVVFATGALFFAKSKEDEDIDADFKDTFKPVAELTGEAFVHEVYTPRKEKKHPTPTVKPEEKKREAKKED